MPSSQPVWLIVASVAVALTVGIVSERQVASNEQLVVEPGNYGQPSVTSKICEKSSGFSLETSLMIRTVCGSALIWK